MVAAAANAHGRLTGPARDPRDERQSETLAKPATLARLSILCSRLTTPRQSKLRTEKLHQLGSYAAISLQKPSS